jgi:histidine phosphotransferase ChpT
MRAGGATGGGAVPLEVLEALCARICHDLVGPVSAVANGAELLEEAGGDDPALAAEAAELIGRSARAASARLQAVRLAFGTAPDGGGHAEDVVRGAAAALAAEGRAALDWPPGALAGAAPQAARVALILAMLAEEALPHGGAVRIRAHGRGVAAEASGRGASLRPEAAAALEGRGDAAAPRAAIALALAAVAGAAGLSVTTEAGEDRVRIAASHP